MCIMRLQVNWQALWKPRWQRSMREVLVLPLIILTMLVPLGVFTGELPCHCRASDDLLASLHCRSLTILLASHLASIHADPILSDCVLMQIRKPKSCIS